MTRNKALLGWIAFVVPTTIGWLVLETDSILYFHFNHIWEMIERYRTPGPYQCIFDQELIISTGIFLMILFSVVTSMIMCIRKE